MNVPFREDFGKLLNELNLNGVGIEIGVAQANYSEILLTTTKLSNIYFVDPWKEYPQAIYNDSTNCSQAKQDARYAAVVEKLKKYNNAHILRQDSIEALSSFSDEFFDFIYIDANHAYEYVKIDVNNWYPKLKKGGVFAGHDYFDGTTKHGVYGVKSAVDEFCKTKNIIPLVTGGTRRCPASWYFIKGAE